MARKKSTRQITTLIVPNVNDNDLNHMSTTLYLVWKWSIILLASTSFERRKLPESQNMPIGPFQSLQIKFTFISSSLLTVEGLQPNSRVDDLLKFQPLMLALSFVLYLAWGTRNKKVIELFTEENIFLFVAIKIIFFATTPSKKIKSEPPKMYLLKDDAFIRHHFLNNNNKYSDQ